MKLFALLSSIACAAARLRFVAPEAPLAVPVSHPDSGSIVISRTVNTDDKAWATGKVTVGPDGTCKSSDDYGSNDCTMNWGSTYTVNFDLDLEKDLDSNAQFNLDHKLDGLIPLKTSCHVCGQNCTITVPIVKKTIVIPLDQPCPVKATDLKNGTSIILPAKIPCHSRCLSPVLP